MPQSRPGGSRRPRDKYSRLICLGCRERRIRCELPSEVEVPDPGELRTVRTPCYRCKRLGIPCVVRQTILGRPGRDNCSTTTPCSTPAGTGDTASRIIIELPSRPAACIEPDTAQDGKDLINDRDPLQSKSQLAKYSLPTQGDVAIENGRTLLYHTPQSAETVIIIRALDTIRCEKVEQEYFRHLPGHVGHTRALDLAVKAIVAACAYSRGVPKLTAGDCYQALALALNAVQSEIKQSHGKPPNDDLLASTALLAPFEGAVRRHGMTTRLHIEGLGAILTARPATYPVTQLARDILDFHACESAIMACTQGTPSHFEGIARDYYVNNRIRRSDSDRAQLKAFSNELFIRIPRLINLLRSLRTQTGPRNELLLQALVLSQSLLRVQNFEAEVRLLQNITDHPSVDLGMTSALRQSLPFISVKDREVLLSYWSSRLCLLRLEWRLQDWPLSSETEADSTRGPMTFLWPSFKPSINEMTRLVNNILLFVDCGNDTFPLRKHDHLFVFAMTVVWGVKMDVPVAFGNSEDEKWTDALSDLVLRRANVAIANKPDITVEEMDTVADIFAGGEPRGRFAKLYAL